MMQYIFPLFAILYVCFTEKIKYIYVFIGLYIVYSGSWHFLMINVNGYERKMYFIPVSIPTFVHVYVIN